LLQVDPVSNFVGMTTREEGKPGRWSGEEVEDTAPGEAERAAERAEGNAPERASDAARPLHEPLDVEPQDQRRRRPSGESPDDKIAEAAEAHREREEEGDRPPRGKL
jgi:hypothetical protein